MNFHCANNIEFSKAKRIAEYFSRKLLDRFKRIKSENLTIWVKQVNPENSAGPEEYKCKVNIRANDKKYFVEQKGKSLKSVIKNAIESLSNKVQKDRFSLRELRSFKRIEVVGQGGKHERKYV